MEAILEPSLGIFLKSDGKEGCVRWHDNGMMA
jgi:hypothetical protein